MSVDIKARRLVSDPSEFADILSPVQKHLPGKHNQQSHAGGASGGLSTAVGYGARDKHPQYDFNNEEGVNLEYYTSSGYREINHYLRQGGKGFSPDEREDIKEYVKGIDSAMRKTNTPREMTTYRGISGEAAEPFRNLKEGDTFTDKGFISTTTQDGQLWDFMDAENKEFGVVLEIKTPADSRMLSVKRYFEKVSSRYGPSQDILDEDEHILPRGTKFRIDGFGAANVRGVEDMVVKVTVVNE